MNPKMTKCKACGQEIAKTAKICPNCGAKNKKKHTILICIIIFFVLIGIIASTGGDDDPQKIDTSSSSKVETSADDKNRNEFFIGETAELKDVLVKLVGVTENTGSQFNTPTDGNIFVLCEFEITNNSNKEVVVSSLMSFEAYCDDYSCSLSFSALMEKGENNQLDGTVAPGKKMKGVIGYEIPADWSKLEIRFCPDFWSGKDIIFLANK